MDLAPHATTLRHLTRTDPDPHVRHRADGLLLIAHGLSLTQAARVFGCARNSLHAWGQRFLAEGRDGLADRGRRGRPPKLDAAARDLLEAALTSSPLDLGSRSRRDSGRPDRPARATRLGRQLAYRLSCPARAGLSVSPAAPRPDAASGCRGRRQRQACPGRTPKKGAAAGAGFRVVYVDECTIQTRPYLAKGWQRRGSVMKVPTGPHQTRTVFGALDYGSGRVCWQIQPGRAEPPLPPSWRTSPRPGQTTTWCWSWTMPATIARQSSRLGGRRRRGGSPRAGCRCIVPIST